MTPPDNRIPLAGSARPPAPGARDARPLDPAVEIDATVVLRRRDDGQLGADPQDVDVVRSALEAAGITVVDVSVPSRRIRIRGRADRLGALFGTALEQVTSRGPTGAEVTHRHRTGELTVPAELAGRVLAVLGLDDRPQARAQFRTSVASAAATSYTPVQLGELYQFPADTDGTGSTVAIIELGGGFAQDDLDTYFAGLGLATPSVTAVGVDGAQNQPGGDPQGADGEVLLDIEIIGALAPAADILVYFAPNSDAGFLDAVSEAVHADPTPAAVSISWGQSEDDWTAQARAAMDAAFADAVQLGVVVTAASGDSGSRDGASDGANHVDFPAASPNVLACGGTSLQASSGAITAETVWNNGSSGGATGGGVSDAFAQPSWQSGVGVPGSGRGVPDVAGDADPETGYRIRVDGQDTVLGGTSAVAPLWAALVARLAQATGGLLAGFLPDLYAGASAGVAPPGLRDITDGDNGGYSAGPGWDACTGLGSPDGTALLQRLRSA
jgi:kumamolisin